MAGLLAFVGFAAGAFLGTRIAPLVLSDGSHSPYAPAFGADGRAARRRGARRRLRGHGLQLRRRLAGSSAFEATDGVLGAVLTACVGLGVVWMLGAVAVAGGAPDLRREVQRSTILAALNTILPPSGAAAERPRAVRPVPADRRPGGAVAPPRAEIAGDPDVRRRRTAW